LGQKNEALGRKIPSRDTTQKVPKSSKFGPKKDSFASKIFKWQHLHKEKRLAQKAKKRNYRNRAKQPNADNYLSVF